MMNSFQRGGLSLINDEQLKSTIAGFYATDLTKEISDEGQRGEYRRSFRMLIDPDMQAALADQCGDRPMEGGDLPNHYLDFVVLDYDCTFDWPLTDIGRATDALRSVASELIPQLSLRIAELDGRDASINEVRQVYGLETFLEFGISE